MDPRELMLFDEMNRKEEDKVLRDEMNIALTPFAYFPGKRGVMRDENGKRIFLYEKEFPMGTDGTVKLIGSRDEEVQGIPEGNDLDYFYALVELLFEQTGFMDDTIYFFITDLIRKAGRHPSQDEILRAIRAIRRYRYLVVRSNATRRTDKQGKPQLGQEEELSYIQHFLILGQKLKKGRRKFNSEDATNGMCQVIFSKYYMQNIVSKELSKPLNYTLMKRLRTPKGKRLFRIIDAFRFLNSHITGDGKELVSKEVIEVARRIPLGEFEQTKLSYIRRAIDPIHEELKSLAFLKDYFYEKVNGTDQIAWVFTRFKTDEAAAYNELVARGITPNAAEELSTKYTAKIMDVLVYCDYKKKEKEQISPGYIRTTIENSNHEQIKQYIDRIREQEKSEKLKDIFTSREKMRMEYELAIENAIDKAYKALSPGDLTELKREAEAGMPYLKNLNSNSAKTEAIEGAIREKIKESLDIPSFETWRRQQDNSRVDLPVFL
jgi:hypothetical protein